VRRTDHILLDGQIVVEKIGWVAVVGENTADARGGEHDHVGPLLTKERARGRLIAQVQFGARPQHEAVVAALAQ